MTCNPDVKELERLDLTISIAKKQSAHVHKSNYKSAMINWENVMEHYDSMTKTIERLRNHILASQPDADAWREM